MNKQEMNHYADTRALFYESVKEGTEDISGKFDRLWKLSRSYARLQENRCNYELSARQEKREENIEREITGICAEAGLTVDFSGDPRGYTVKIHVPSGRHNTWGGKQDGWGIA